MLNRKKWLKRFYQKLNLNSVYDVDQVKKVIEERLEHQYAAIEDYTILAFCFLRLNIYSQAKEKIDEAIEFGDMPFLRVLKAMSYNNKNPISVERELKKAKELKRQGIETICLQDLIDPREEETTFSDYSYKPKLDPKFVILEELVIDDFFSGRFCFEGLFKLYDLLAKCDDPDEGAQIIQEIRDYIIGCGEDMGYYLSRKK